MKRSRGPDLVAWACLLTGLMLLGAVYGAHAQSPVRSCAEGATPTQCGSIISPITSLAVESSHVFKAKGPSTVVDFQVSNTSASTLWVMVFDAAVAPTGAGAAVTGCGANQQVTRPCVAKWYQIGANSTIGVTWSPGPFPTLQTGQVVVCSSTGPFTLTYSVNCVFSGEAM